MFIKTGKTTHGWEHIVPVPVVIKYPLLFYGQKTASIISVSHDFDKDRCVLLSFDNLEWYKNQDRGTAFSVIDDLIIFRECPMEVCQ